LAHDKRDDQQVMIMKHNFSHRTSVATRSQNKKLKSSNTMNDLRQFSLCIKLCEIII